MSSATHAKGESACSYTSINDLTKDRYLLETSGYIELKNLIDINTIALKTLPEKDRTVDIRASLASHHGPAALPHGESERRSLFAEGVPHNWQSRPTIQPEGMGTGCSKYRRRVLPTLMVSQRRSNGLNVSVVIGWNRQMRSLQDKKTGLQLSRQAWVWHSSGLASPNELEISCTMLFKKRSPVPRMTGRVRLSESSLFQSFLSQNTNPEVLTLRWAT